MSEHARWVRYRTTDGAVMGVTDMPIDATPRVPDGVRMAYLQAPRGSKGRRLRVDVSDPANPHLVERDPLPVEVSGVPVPADGETEARIKVPAGTIAFLPDGVTLVVEDWVLEVTFDVPGAHTLSFEHPLYLPATVTVEAT